MLDTEGVIEGIFGEAATGDLDGVMSWWAPDGILEDITLARAFRGHARSVPTWRCTSPRCRASPSSPSGSS